MHLWRWREPWPGMALQPMTGACSTQAGVCLYFLKQKPPQQLACIAALCARKLDGMLRPGPSRLSHCINQSALKRTDWRGPHCLPDACLCYVCMCMTRSHTASLQATCVCPHQQPRGTELLGCHVLCGQLCMGQPLQHDLSDTAGGPRCLDSTLQRSSMLGRAACIAWAQATQYSLGLLTLFSFPLSTLGSGKDGLTSFS